MPIAAPDGDRLFIIGSTYLPLERQKSYTVIDLPSVKLDLPSGRVCACDPLTSLDENSVAFSEAVEPGTYTVSVSLVEVDDVPQPRPWGPYREVAAARLQILDRPVAVWELALIGSQDVADLDGDSFYGYGVDAGAGCFIDVSVAGAVGAYSDESEALFGAMWDGDEQRPLSKVTDPGTGHSVVIFPSGAGDGMYPTWIGRTAEGEIACFVTEFFVVPDECTRGV